jgi:hypothetical protein
MVYAESVSGKVSRRFQVIARPGKPVVAGYPAFSACELLEQSRGLSISAWAFW